MKPQNLSQGSFRPAVFIVVYKRNTKTKQPAYLILKRKKHWTGWEFPKGGIERNESIKSAVRREVYEECGLRPISIKNHNIRGSYRYKGRYPDRRGIMGQTYTLFSAEVPEGKVRIDRKEHSFYQWLPYEKAENILTHRNQKKCLSIVSKRIR